MALAVSDPEIFAKHIEKLVVARSCSYLDAVVEFCTVRDLEVESIVPYLSDKIKTAIGNEAKALHLVKHSAELPF